VRGLLPRTAAQDERYTNPDHDSRGEWASDNYVSNKSKEERPTLWYAIKHPKSGEDVWPDEHAVWRYSYEKHLVIERESRLYWGPDQSYRKPRLKRYLTEVQQGLVPSTWWTHQECGHNDEAQKETAALLAQKVFSTPKPLRLLRRIMEIGTAQESIVLDFFAGSGATGHAVTAYNAADGGHRRYVLVQLPEPLDHKNKDQRIAAEFCDKIGKPRNIAELTKERLRRAANKVKNENPLFAGDVGFRVFKLDSSNIRAWDPDRDDLGQTLQDSITHLKTDRCEADILYELLLKLGLDLCVLIENRSIRGKEVHAVGGGVLLACLATEISRDEVEPLALGIVEWHKSLAPAGDTTCVFRDSAFVDDVAKTNLAAILEQHGIATVRSL
jgi:adenine-specific DNA-methyltransferase